MAAVRSCRGVWIVEGVEQMARRTEEIVYYAVAIEPVPQLSSKRDEAFSRRSQM